MTRQIKSGMGNCGFRAPNLVSVFRHLKGLQVALASVLVFGLQLGAQAQGNLVDLYNWENETVVGSDPNPNDYLAISSAISARFSGGYTDQGGGVSPILTGSFATTPGATYQISFTMCNLNSFGGSASETFGDNSMNFDLPFVYLDGGESYSDTPVNIDFTAIATSATTTMSIECYLDPDGGSAALSDLIVTEGPELSPVPEVSSIGLFCFGGCALLLARNWQRFFPKLKTNRIRC
jgi:hypothetical protein